MALPRTVEGYVTRNQEKFIQALTVFCAQPSISAKGEGIRECAALLERMMKEAGITTTLVEVKGGNPILFGEVKSKSSRKTLIFYSHYDVQPPEPLSEWKSPPFEPTIRDGLFYARGAADNKGNLVSKLVALESYLATTHDVPINLKFVFEGEEEVGSPNLPGFIRTHREELKGDVTVGEGGPVDGEGRPIVRLGNKGMLYVDLKTTGAASDLHSSEAAIVANPAWRLVWALSTLKGEDERVRVAGFYDDVKQFNAEERKMIHDSPFDEKDRKKDRGIDKFLLGATGDDLKLRFYGEPTCNICGFITGYNASGVKTVLPREASAKLDFRLAPDQDPEDILSKLKAHFAKNGFTDVQVTSVAQLMPSRTPATNLYALAAASAVKQVYGKEPVIELTSAGSGPRYLFERELRAPMINAGGCANLYSRIHGPNENVAVRDYIAGIRANAALMEAFGRAG